VRCRPPSRDKSAASLQCGTAPCRRASHRAARRSRIELPLVSSSECPCPQRSRSKCSRGCARGRSRAPAHLAAEVEVPQVAHQPHVLQFPMPAGRRPSRSRVPCPAETARRRRRPPSGRCRGRRRRRARTQLRGSAWMSCAMDSLS
jgi:hypothetical protein